MPVHYATPLRKGNLYQTTPTRTATARTRLRVIHGTMGGTHQPVARAVEKSIGLVVHFHGHMRASIEIGVHLVLVPNAKGLAGLTTVDDVKGHGLAAIHQIVGVTQRDFADHGQTLTSQAFASSH
jgi:hypothetical protein